MTPKKPTPRKSKAIREDELQKIELDPAAWPKFEKLIKSAAKRGPIPRSGRKHGDN